MANWVPHHAAQSNPRIDRERATSDAGLLVSVLPSDGLGPSRPTPV